LQNVTNMQRSAPKDTFHTHKWQCLGVTAGVLFSPGALITFIRSLAFSFHCS